MVGMSKKQGFTILEMLVSISIASIIIMSGVYLFKWSATAYNDLSIRESSHANTEALLNLIGSDLKLIGNGIPFDLANFEMDDILQDDDGVLSSAFTATHPINISTATATYIQYKFNQSGKIYFLTAAMTPNASGTSTVQLSDTSGLFAGDTIYISNALINGEEALQGEIESVDSATQITLTADWIRSPDAVFSAGSTLEAVNTVTLSASGGQILRDEGFGNVVLADHASFSLVYLDYAGNVITPPLTVNALDMNLREIEVSVTFTSAKRNKVLQSPGATHSLTKTQTFGIRSLNL